MKKLLSAAAVAMALSSSAYAVNVGGVVWNPDSIFDFRTTDSMFESIAGFTSVTPVGGNLFNFTGATELKGYAQIDKVNAVSTFCPGCELTYEFGGYFLSQWRDMNGSGTINAGDELSFTGGWVKFYVDTTPDFDATNPATAGSQGGTNALWLELAGFTQTDSTGNLTGTLFSTFLTGSLGTGDEGGSGRGNFDVVGGLAAGNFDTNTKQGGSDFRFTSSYQPIDACLEPGAPDLCKSFPLFGSNDLSGNSIPEPASLALLGLGLAGLGAVARKRKA